MTHIEVTPVRTLVWHFMHCKMLICNPRDVELVEHILSIDCAILKKTLSSLKPCVQTHTHGFLQVKIVASSQTHMYLRTELV